MARWATRDGRRLIWAAGALAALYLAVAPHVLSTYFRVFFTEMLIWGLFAMAFDVIYGYAGMLSFGQSTFFGLGAYAVALAVTRADAGVGTALLAAVVASVALAAVLGYFAVKVSGHYFVIITVVFSLVIFRLTLQYKSVTGGDDGLSFQVPTIRLGRWDLSLYDPVVNYYFVLAVVLVCFVACHRMMRSPWGRIFVAIRENESRARLIGYDVEGYKLLAFVVSGLFSGVAGALYALTFRYSNASLLHWTVSGQAVLWDIVGGAGTLVGPFLGTGLMVGLADYASSWLEQYQILLGTFIILVVIFAPRGILGLVTARLGARARRDAD
jgi:branched-chain amino acid transport system permease protein